MNRLCSLGIVLASLLCLPACSLLSPVKVMPQNEFTLSHADTPKMVTPTQRAILYVAMTTSAPGYDRDDMMYMKRAYQIERYAQNKWIAPPAQLFNQVFVESLQNSHVYKSVVGPAYTGLADWRVDTQLDHLYQDFSTGRCQIDMAVSVQVINNLNHTVVASRPFSTRAPCSSEDAYGGVLATNHATRQLVSVIDSFVVQAAHFS